MISGSSQTEILARGKGELRAARTKSRPLFWIIGILSVCINLLMLTGPLFMLQVYDRVLGSGSEATLVALFSIVVFLYLMMGLLDISRSKILSRIAARFQTSLEPRVFEAAISQAAKEERPHARSKALDQLSQIRRFFSSPAFSALYDLPFTPLFLLGIAIFHPYLGILALSGGATLVGLALLNRKITKPMQSAAQSMDTHASQMASRLTSSAESLKALGMQMPAYSRWLQLRHKALEHTVQSDDMAQNFTASSKALRLLLQSALLALGAWLVLQRELSPGAMIASSILFGRAIQPVDILINQWNLVQMAQTAWGELAELLGLNPARQNRTELPVPKAKIAVTQLTVAPPREKQASLKAISFNIEPGEALGVIGPSGSGKSTLARALTHVWPAAGGSIRLDGATLDQYMPEALGQYIGYLPQQVPIFDGTIAENIAKLALQPNAEAVVAAAKKADAHEMILSLPKGYDTMISATGSILSGGQLQRIGLARAFFGNPALVILDEPNSNLDNAGSMALNAAIRRHKDEGGAIMIMAHRPSAIQECDKLLVLEKGIARAFGPRDAVLKEVVKNSNDIIRGPQTNSANPQGEKK